LFFPLPLPAIFPQKKAGKNSRTPENTAISLSSPPSTIPESPPRRPFPNTTAGFLLPAILHTSRKEKGRRCLKTLYLWAFIEVEGRKEIPEREKERG
ncbi:MAG: hypothetical protein NC305_14735, partial [Lachnospiraceae bacterium]|nr:hypothetical protein [Lachnospiraceae bacterium]